MSAIFTRMLVGFPGAVTRADSLTILPELIDPANPPAAYGAPVKLVSGLVDALVSGDPASVIYGLSVRAYPVQSTTNTLGQATPPTSGVLDVMKRGYIAVALAYGTAVKGAQAFWRTTANGGRSINQWEAAQEWGTASAAKAGITGNGTFVPDATNPTPGPNVVAGVYTLVMTSATNARLSDPNGRVLSDNAIVATNGSSVTVNDVIKGVLTEGATTFVAGDQFNITVTANTVPVFNTFFAGPADATGVVELSYNI